MRDYQPTKNNKWQLDPAIYKLMLCIVRSYPKLKKDVEQQIYIPAHDFVVVGSGNTVKSTGSATERKAIVLASKSTKVDAVNKALQIVPEEYRKPIINNIIHNKPLYSYDYASVTTLSRHKSRFLYKLAYELDYI